MSFQGKLEIDGKPFNLIKFSLGLNQSIDQHNRPNSTSRGGVFSITIESSNNNAMLEWMISPSMMKNGTITFSRRDNASSMRTVKFTDAFCVNYTEHFDAINEHPMSIDLTISSRVLDFGGSLTITNNWPGSYSDSSSDGAATSTTISDEGITTTTTLEPETDISTTDTLIEPEIATPETANTIGQDLDEGIADVETKVDEVRTEIETKREEIKAKKEELKEEAKDIAEEYVPGSKEVINEVEAEIKAGKEAVKEEISKHYDDVKNMFGGGDDGEDIPNPSDLFG